MYVIFKREEIQEKMHIKRAALDTALAQLKKCNLICCPLRLNHTVC